MKLPLKYGIPLLIVLWLASGMVEYGQGKTLLMVLAMGVAMWTAFSLPFPRSRQAEELDEANAAEPAAPAKPEPTQSQAKEGKVPANGSGQPLSRSQPQTEKES